MKIVLKYIKDYKKESILAPLFKMLEATFELFIPLVIGAMIKVGIHNEDKQYVINMCLIMVALGIIGLICSVTAQYFAAKAAVSVAAKLRQSMFRHIQSLRYEKLDEVGTSTLITRMTSDINQVQSGINMFLRLFLRSPFIVIGAVVMAFVVDPKAAVVFVIAVPILSVVVFAIVFANIPLYKKVQGDLDQVTLATRENLNGVRVIRAFQNEDEEIEAFSVKNMALTKLQLFAGRISSLLNPLTYVIINLALVVLLWTGAFRVHVGGIEQGDLISLINYMSQILVELVKLANLIVTLTKAMACAARLDETMAIEEGMGEADSKQDVKQDENPSQSHRKDGFDGSSKNGATSDDVIIDFRDVSLAYHNAAEESLKDLNFAVKRGQTIGIIGGTGSGKSSLVQLIPRLYDVTGGAVYVDGMDVRDYDVDALRQKIGMVPQKVALFKGTIRDNILFGNKEATDDMVDEAIRVACAKEFIEEKDGGLDFMVEQGGRNLSGGQKQRITIARALVRQPEILILDDSCSALDYATDAKLRAGIKALPYHPTLLIVSQRTVSIASADLILVLDDGKLVGMGTHDDLLASCEVYQEIYASQYTKESEVAFHG